MSRFRRYVDDEYVLNKIYTLVNDINDYAPSIDVERPADVAEVVRCKDCKYASDSDYTHCSYVTWYNGKDDFCSRGERRDNE